MRRLPPLFDKMRHRLGNNTPSVVIWFKTMDRLPTLSDITTKYGGEKGKDADVPMLLYSPMWMELPECSLLVNGVNLNHYEIGVADKQSVKRGELLDRFNVVRNVHDTSGDPDLDLARKLLMGEAMRIFHYLYLEAERPAEISVNTKTRNAPRCYSRVDNTARFAPISSLHSTAGQSRQRDYTAPDEPSGIRMCEHEVRGHWRTYSSGVRVWVKPHKRGDPELGTTTRILT